MKENSNLNTVEQELTIKNKIQKLRYNLLLANVEELVNILRFTENLAFSSSAHIPNMEFPNHSSP